jgi:hypothetical protein
MSKTAGTRVHKGREKMKRMRGKTWQERKNLGSSRSAMQFHHGILLAWPLPGSVILLSLFLLFPASVAQVRTMLEWARPRSLGCLGMGKGAGFDKRDF